MVHHCLAPLHFQRGQIMRSNTTWSPWHWAKYYMPYCEVLVKKHRTAVVLLKQLVNWPKHLIKYRLPLSKAEHLVTAFLPPQERHDQGLCLLSHNGRSVTASHWNTQHFKSKKISLLVLQHNSPNSMGQPKDWHTWWRAYFCGDLHDNQFIRICHHLSQVTYVHVWIHSTVRPTWPWSWQRWHYSSAASPHCSFSHSSDTYL